MSRRSTTTAALFILLSLLFGWAPAFAGMTLSAASLQCDQLRAQGGPYAISEFRVEGSRNGYPQVTGGPQSGSQRVTTLDDYSVWLPTAGVPAHIANCSQSLAIDYRNDPRGPTRGQFTSSQLSGAQTLGYLTFTCGALTLGCVGAGVFGFPASAPILPPLCGAAEIPCAALILLEWGVILSELSPAFASGFAPPIVLGAGTESLLIPFLVLNAGDGDWLSMGLFGSEVFRQPLSAFTPGGLYYAQLPVAGVAGRISPHFEFFLESTGSSNASVVIGGLATTPLPEPATLTLIGIALAGLAFTRRRKQ